MLLMELTYEEEQGFIRDIYDIKNKFRENNIIIGIVESMKEKTHFMKIFCDDKNFSEKVKNSMNLYISNVLYKIIVDIFRKKELFEYITDTYFFLNHEEIFELEENIIETLNGKAKIKDDFSFSCMNIINSMIEKIKECIEENEEINIDGFIRFRSRELAKDIEAVVDKSIEKYMIDREYNEFIKLLKYFVEVQDSKIDELNLIIEPNGKYLIMDDKGKDIYEKFVGEMSDCKIGSGINSEDVIISGLITSVPKKIIVHLKDNCINKDFLNTISKVFGERLIYCEKCSMCEKNKIN